MAKAVAKFGKYVRERRKNKNLSLRQFSKKSRIPLSSLFQIEAGKSPKLAVLDQLAKAFKEDLPTFLGPVYGPKTKEARE